MVGRVRRAQNLETSLPTEGEYRIRPYGNF